jgi:hypothetical protein
MTAKGRVGVRGRQEAELERFALFLAGDLFLWSSQTNAACGPTPLRRSRPTPLRKVSIRIDLGCLFSGSCGVF